MKRRAFLVLTMFSLPLLGCNKPTVQSEPAAAVSIAISLVPGNPKQVAACENGFDEVGPDRFEEREGAKWVWLSRADGTLSHYCRKDGSGELRAWTEAESADSATHKLTFNGGEQPAVFQPLPER